MDKINIQLVMSDDKASFAELYSVCMYELYLRPERNSPMILYIYIGLYTYEAKRRNILH